MPRSGSRRHGSVSGGTTQPITEELRRPLTLLRSGHSRESERTQQRTLSSDSARTRTRTRHWEAPDIAGQRTEGHRRTDRTPDRPPPPLPLSLAGHRSLRAVGPRRDDLCGSAAPGRRSGWQTDAQKWGTEKKQPSSDRDETISAAPRPPLSRRADAHRWGAEAPLRSRRRHRRRPPAGHRE